MKLDYVATGVTETDHIETGLHCYKSNNFVALCLEHNFVALCLEYNFVALCLEYNFVA